MSNKKDKKGDDSCCRSGRKVFEGRLLSFQEDIINDHPINGRGRKRSSMRKQGKSLAKLCIALRWRDKRGLLSSERERGGIVTFACASVATFGWVKQRNYPPNLKEII